MLSGSGQSGALERLGAHHRSASTSEEQVISSAGCCLPGQIFQQEPGERHLAALLALYRPER
ncbi:MAG: hypothetical protein ACJ8DJ_00120, partial [Gemmatimonadales bacterium]